MLLLSSNTNDYASSGSYRNFLCPGIGLVQEQSLTRRGARAAEEVLLFEHTEMGTGGLVLNCPTPLRINEIAVDRFKPFGDLPLMMGSGLMEIDEEEEDDTKNDHESTRTTTSAPATAVPLGDCVPWFWIHNLSGDIPGSAPLEGADGPLFMGGDLQQIADYLRINHIDPAGRIQFFRKYKQWGPGDLLREIEQGCMWSYVGPQSPDRALRVF